MRQANLLQPMPSFLDLMLVPTEFGCRSSASNVLNSDIVVLFDTNYFVLLYSIADHEFVWGARIEKIAAVPSFLNHGFLRLGFTSRGTRL